ncbi:MAG: PEP-utilizing enzyme [Gammaproteobacteria bacterium]|nr:PEP-utilizing enzyme [Gammaproteobacteria bacterium]MDG2339012.1 PEP-utilizing enzyme [Gammaproteobacteria bacterium]
MERKFEAPGPGTWALDTTHNSGAMTLYSTQTWPGLRRGFHEGLEKYGILLDYLQPSFVHGFIYMQQVGIVGKPGGGPPPKFLFQLMFKIHPKLRARVKAAHSSVESRRWLQDLEEWDELKKDSIARNTRLQSVNFSEMDRAGLIEHLEACFENAEEMVYRHHKYSVGSILPIGRFLDVATRTSGLTAVEVAPLLKGSTPVSKGIGGEQLLKLAATIAAAGLTKAELEGQPAEAALARLREHATISAALDEYLTVAGYMLIGGYCISEKTLNESPNIILARIYDALDPRAESDLDQGLERKIREKIPEADRAEFDLSLADARMANRMRDERGIYNDIWGAGIARTAILEAGRRLLHEGKILSNQELALDATHEELLSLLKGEFSITESQLQERRDWRLSKAIDEVPEFLGPEPAEPPPIEWLPLKIQPMMRAFSLVMGNVFDEPKEVTEKIGGLAVSPGVYEGTAKVIISTRDFDRLEKGDILVTKNTSAGFNVVLPIIGALVTDRGGILSHAAIVSREFGIPGVVGTKNASQLIKDGDKIRVKGDTGEVEIL